MSKYTLNVTQNCSYPCKNSFLQQGNTAPVTVWSRYTKHHSNVTFFIKCTTA